MKNAVIILLLVIIAGLIYSLGIFPGRSKKAPGRVGNQAEMTAEDLMRILDLDIKKYSVSIPNGKNIHYLAWVEEWTDKSPEPKITVINDCSRHFSDMDRKDILQDWLVQFPSKSNRRIFLNAGGMTGRLKVNTNIFDGSNGTVPCNASKIEIEFNRVMPLGLFMIYDLDTVNGVSSSGGEAEDMRAALKKRLADLKGGEKYYFALLNLYMTDIHDEYDEKMASDLEPVFRDGEVVIDGIPAEEDTPDVF